MKILYVGGKNGTSLQRANAMLRVGYDLLHLDPQEDLPKRWGQWQNYQGGAGLDWLVARSLRRRIPDGARFDLVHVDGGVVIGKRSVTVLRSVAPRVSNYNADNPYIDPSPERRRWDIMRSALPFYDLAVTIRRPGIEDQMRKHGVLRPMTIWQCADEKVHALVTDAPEKFCSDVCFAGTWMPGREIFMEELIKAGVNLALYGPRWNKAKNYDKLRPHVRANYLEGRDYAYAIGGAKIGLVVLNSRNQDLHTKRTVEIPAVGSAVCAQRTPYHEELYKEGQEALFFESAPEAAEKCLALLADPDRLAAMTAAGRARIEARGLFNETLMRRIAEAAVSPSDHPTGGNDPLSLV